VEAEQAKNINCNIFILLDMLTRSKYQKNWISNKDFKIFWSVSIEDVQARLCFIQKLTSQQESPQ
jgi:hypothetical protein